MNAQRTTLAICLGVITVSIVAYLYFSMGKQPSATGGQSAASSQQKFSDAELAEALKKLSGPNERSVIPKEQEKAALKLLGN